MEDSNLTKKFMQVLNEVPNFSTDETANAGSRTYKYLNLATLLKNIKPIFEKHDIAFSQKVTFDSTATTDTSVLISSADPAIVAAPVSVTIPANSHTANFTVAGLVAGTTQIGRASCRERVCQYV